MSRRSVAILGLLAGGAALAWWRSRIDDGGYGWPGDSAIVTPGYAEGGDWVEAGLRLRGVAPWTAQGVAAGSWAESLQDPTAVNPTSGAYGIGQWLGSRKAELFRRYGSSPSAADQLDFLAWELGGGDYGGAAVLAQSSPAGALDAYIRRFMRPKAGAQTTGDLARGLRYLG